MLFFAGLFFGLAAVGISLDLANVKFAHGVGPMATLMLALAFACLIARAVIANHHDHHPHAPK